MSQAGANDDWAPHVVDAVPREARPFQGQRAGVVTRTVANTIDFAVMVGVLAGSYAAWSAITFLIKPKRFTMPEPSFGLMLIAGGAFLICYFTAAWATTGRTYGDHLLGLRVVNFRGERMHLAGALVRAVFCVFLPIGLYWVIVSPTNRSVQDTVLRTSVLYDWTARRQVIAQPVALPHEPHGESVIRPAPASSGPSESSVDPAAAEQPPGQ